MKPTKPCSSCAKHPEHLLIIGGGPIGMEMAQAHIRLGSKVTVIEGAKALGKDDPELAEVVLTRLRDEGVEIAEDALAAEIRGQAGAIEVEVKDGRVFKGSHLLMAVGRKANTDKLNLEAAGIEPTATASRWMQACAPPTAKFMRLAMWRAGCNSPMSRVSCGRHHPLDAVWAALQGKDRHIPWATYTDPELSQVGMTEAQARETHGDKLEVVRFDYSHNDRAIAERKTKGLSRSWS